MGSNPANVSGEWCGVRTRGSRRAGTSGGERPGRVQKISQILSEAEIFPPSGPPLFWHRALRLVNGSVESDKKLKSLGRRVFLTLNPQITRRLGRVWRRGASPKAHFANYGNRQMCINDKESWVEVFLGVFAIDCWNKLQNSIR